MPEKLGPLLTNVTKTGKMSTYNSRSVQIEHRRSTTGVSGQFYNSLSTGTPFAIPGRVKMVRSIRFLILTLGILVALFIALTLINSKMLVSGGDKPQNPAFWLLPAFPTTEQTDIIRVFAERS